MIHFHVKAEGVGTFTAAVQKINEGLKKTNSMASNARWYVMSNGDDGPLYAVVLERSSWADFQGPSLRQLHGKCCGKGEVATC